MEKLVELVKKIEIEKNEKINVISRKKTIKIIKRKK